MKFNPNIAENKNTKKVLQSERKLLSSEDKSPIDYINDDIDNYDYNVLKDGILSKYVSPINIKATPIKKDYISGFITRYFTVKLNEPSIIYEISKEQFDYFGTPKIGINSLLYEKFKCDWKLTGVVYDVINNNNAMIVEYGFYDTNKRTIDNLKSTYKYIQTKLNDPFEFTIEGKIN